MALGVSDDILSIFVPLAVYWLYSALYMALDGLGVSSNYRLHPKEDEDTKNLASKRAVLKSVLLQQAGQVAVQLAIIKVHY
jgi:sphinganine C4-monooxygenase